MRSADRIDALALRLGLDAERTALLRAELLGFSAPWERRQDRLDRRDGAVRATISAFYPGLSQNASAHALARDLDAYLSTSWRFESDKESLDEKASAKRTELHRIARGNDGRSLGWRQIINIVSGDRGR